MHPLVAHCKTSRYDVLIDRTTIWGNPFLIGRDGTRRDVIRKYAEWLPKQKHLMTALDSLRGQILGCWCAPHKACHGEVLADLANAPKALFAKTVNKTQTSKGVSMSKHDDDDDDNDSDEVFIKSLGKDRQKLLLARGVPGQDMIPKKTSLPLSNNLVKMEPNIPRALSKIIPSAKQMKNLRSILANPLRSAYTLGLGSFPSDLRAKHLAITIMNAAIDEYLRKRPAGRTYPLWHRVYGSLGDPLRDKPVMEMPSMLIISNVNMESSAIKIEKVRDLLEKFSDIPRIVICGGEPPVDLFANKLHYQMKAGIYVGPANRVREN